MFFTLNRTEDNNIAVLCDDNGRIYNVNINDLSENISIGDVFICKDGKYIFNAKETAERRARISKKRNEFFNNLKKKNKY